MDEQMTERLTRLVAGHGLKRRPAVELDGVGSEPPGEADWLLLRSRLLSARLTGLAVAAAAEGVLSLTQEQEAELLEQQRARMARALVLERTLLTVTAELERAAIPVLALKGSSFAHTAYPDPSWRDFDDVDLLVPTNDFARAGRVLVEAGCNATTVAPRPGFVERFGKAGVFRKDVFEIDLHRTLMLGPYSIWVDAERLFAERSTFPLGGRRISCLSPELRFIHACMHAILGANPPLLLPLRDVAEIDRAGDIDMDAMARDARTWRLESVIALAAKEVRERLDVEPGPILSAFDTVRPSRLERKAVRAYLEVGHSGGRTSSSMIRVLPGVRPKLAYLRAIVLPDEDFLVRHTGGSGSKWRGYARRWRQLFRTFRNRRRGV